MRAVPRILLLTVRMRDGFLAAPSPKAEAKGKSCIKLSKEGHGKCQMSTQLHTEKGKS